MNRSSKNWLQFPGNEATTLRGLDFSAQGLQRPQSRLKFGEFLFSKSRQPVEPILDGVQGGFHAFMPFGKIGLQNSGFVRFVPRKR
jgi:hypothetical protein